MKKIALSGKHGKGKFALVDDVDYEWLSQWVWSCSHHPKRKNRYATTKIEGRTVRMHQLILPNASQVDHKDGDGLNNQRSNLRAATHAENQRNKHIYCNNTSGYKGVSHLKNRPSQWVAHIAIDGIRIRLGAFRTPEEAAYVYDQVALQLFGDYAKPNLIY